MAYRLSVVAATTFTPTLTGGSTAGTTTYTTQSGYYIVIGNIVYVSFNISITAATGTGDARIGNLPFSINSSSPGIAGAAYISASGWAWPASTTSFSLQGVASNSYVTAFCTGSSVAGSALQMTNAACLIQGTVNYRI